MGKAEWGVDPEFFGPRHAHREDRIVRRLRQVAPGPGLHFECAAGVGSLALSLAQHGRTVVAADLSARSLLVLRERAEAAGLEDGVLPVLADVTQIPFAEGSFDSASTAETLEHVQAHRAAVTEFARVLKPGGWLVGTVPAGPAQWSDWDHWAGHLRRYSSDEMERLLGDAGLDADVVVWGWPLLRLYDDLFLKRVNRRRLRSPGSVEDDATLRRLSDLGRKRHLVGFVRSLFSIDRLFDGLPWGVGLLFSGRKHG